MPVSVTTTGIYGRTQASSFIIDSTAYIGAGWTFKDSINFDRPFLTDFWKFSPNENSWSQVASLPQNMGGRSKYSFGINGKGYICTEKMTNIYKFDPSNNSWSAKAADPNNSLTLCFSFSLNNYGYVGSGHFYNKSGVSIYATTLYKYDAASDSWSQATDFPSDNKTNASTFVSDNKAYVKDGAPTEDDTKLSSDVYSFDGTNWTKLTSIANTKIQRTKASAFAFNNWGYLVGGSTDGGYTSNTNTWSYDIANNKWYSNTDLPLSYIIFYSLATDNGIGSSINNKGYYLGGVNSIQQYGVYNEPFKTTNFFEFDPKSNYY